MINFEFLSSFLIYNGMLNKYINVNMDTLYITKWKIIDLPGCVVSSNNANIEIRITKLLLTEKNEW